MTHSKKLLALFCAITLLLSLYTSHVTTARTMNIYITPASQQVALGSTFTVQVKASSEYIGYIRATTSGALLFPAAQLRVTGTSNSGSAYPGMTVNHNNSTGVIDFTGSNTPGPSGVFHVFTVTFQAIGSGTAPVSFSSSTKVNSTYRSGSDVTTSAGGSFIIPAPPAPTPTPTPSPTPAPPPNPTPTPTPTPTAPSQEAEPTVDETAPEETPEQTSQGGLEIKDTTVTPTRSGVSLAWRMNLPDSISRATYGESKDSQTTKIDVTKSEDGQFTASIKAPKLGVRYYFTLTATAGDGQSATYSGSFTPAGYPVRLSIKENGKSARNTVVKINNKDYKTDDKGIVSLELADGKYTAIVTTSDKSQINATFIVKALDIPDTGEIPRQDIPLEVTTAPASQEASAPVSPTLLIGGAIGFSILLFGGLVGFLLYRRKQLDVANDTDTVAYSPVMSEVSYQHDIDTQSYREPSEYQQNTEYSSLADTPSPPTATIPPEQPTSPSIDIPSIPPPEQITPMPPESIPVEPMIECSQGSQSISHAGNPEAPILADPVVPPPQQRQVISRDDPQELTIRHDTR